MPDQSKLRNRVFDLLAEENDEFCYLIGKYEISPATDLRHADLAGVNFGHLVAPVIDLTGSDISGADLSKIKCDRLILNDAVITPETKLPPQQSEGQTKKATSRDIFERALLAVHRYEPTERLVQILVEDIANSRAPTLVWYHTAAEQDYLTKGLLRTFGTNEFKDRIDALHQPATDFFDLRARSQDLPKPLHVVFYTQRGSSATSDLTNPQQIDRRLYDIVLGSQPSDDDKISAPGLQSSIAANREIIKRIQSSIEGQKNKSSDFQAEFARGVTRALPSHSTICFSGFPLVSKRLFDEVYYARRLKFVFLGHGMLEKSLSSLPLRKRTQIYPKHTLRMPDIMREEDVRNLTRRIHLATENLIRVGPETSHLLKRNVNKSLSLSRSLLIDRILRAAKEVVLQTYPMGPISI